MLGGHKSISGGSSITEGKVRFLERFLVTDEDQIHSLF